MTYPTDLSDAEFRHIEPHLPAANQRGRPKVHRPREILNAVFYVLTSGCPWRLLPREFPPWRTMGAGASTTKSVGGLGAALFKGVGDVARTDKPSKNARDGYMSEHMEIAAYELLERLAKRAGDEETAEVARQNRSDEEAMAKKIESNWERFLDLTLAEPGLLGQ